MKTRTIIEMDSYELDQLVATHIPNQKGWAFVVDQEAGNDSSHSFNGIGIPANYGATIDPKLIESWRLRELNDSKAFIAGQKVSGFGAHQVLETLVRLGVLQPGDYLIKVCW